jgi:hypothetical protein
MIKKENKSRITDSRKRNRNSKPKLQQHRKHKGPGLLCPNISEMNFWREFAKSEIPARFGFHLPIVYVDYLVECDLENVFVRQTAPVRQQEIVAGSLLRAARAYEKLIDRAVERGNEQFPNGGIPPQEFRTMVEKAVHDAINESETALYRAPLGIDIFTDVIWPQAKKLLAGRYDWVMGIDTDDDQRYVAWLRDGDY